MKKSDVAQCARTWAAITLCSVCITFGDDAQADGKVPVYLTSTVAKNDMLGQPLAFELKESSRGSEGFPLIEDVKQFPYIKMSLVTVGPSAGGPAVGYVISYDDLWVPISGLLITSGVLTCP